MHPVQTSRLREYLGQKNNLSGLGYERVQEIDKHQSYAVTVEKALTEGEEHRVEQIALTTAVVEHERASLNPTWK